MAKINSFAFGSIVIEGRRYGTDVLLFPDGSVKKRKNINWKFGSHTINKDEIEELVKANPEVIIVGTGIDEEAKLTPDAKACPAEAKLELVALASPKAVERLNLLTEEGKRVAALIHINC